MVTYLPRFAPRLSEATAPLRQLLKDNNKFVWDSNHDTAFQQVKHLLTQEPGPVLTYFDHTKDVKLQSRHIQKRLRSRITPRRKTSRIRIQSTE